MHYVRQIGTGLLLAVISVTVVIGGYLLASIEGAAPASIPATATLQLDVPTTFATIPVLTAVSQSTSVIISTETLTSTPTEVASITPLPTSASCTPPQGWVAVLVQSTDTLVSLSQIYQLSTATIMNSNCLFSDQLVSGSVLYLPPLPQITATTCSAPSGWTSYTVQSGDTLYTIGIRYRITVSTLQAGNCMGNSTFIQAGRPIRVPFVATSTPLVTVPTVVIVPTATPTSQPTATATTQVPPPPATATSTNTPVPPPTIAPSNTLSPTATNTPG